MEIFQTDKEREQTVKQLEEQRSLRKQRGLLAKEFLQSEFLLQFLLPDIEAERMGAYPKPTEENWQEKYTYAYAKDEVYSGFMKKLQMWSKEAEEIVAKEEEIPKTIV